MSRILCVLALAAGGIFCAALPARSEEVKFLFGVENGQFQAGLTRTNDPADTGQYTAHHATSSATMEWSLNKNFKLRMALGTITSNLDDKVAAKQYLSSTGGAIHFLVGVALEQELDTGGGFLVDLSYSEGTTNEYGHKRTGFFVGYAFGDVDRAQLYTGVAYNTYTSKEFWSVLDKEFEYSQRLNAVVGVRARTETSLGLMELTLGGELGLRLGLAFGF